MMIRQAGIVGVLVAGLCAAAASAGDELAAGFAKPPDVARPWCYWWWLNGAASQEGITRDFEEMRKQGIGGALLFDAGEAGPDAPRGPEFMSADWRKLFIHAVREADRCGVVLSVNLCSGWNAGGPWVTNDHAAMKLVAAQTVVKGPGRVTVTLAKPAVVQDFYRDIAVLACPIPEGTSPGFTLRASSQYRDYGPALAEDGADDTRWISNGDKPGMGPTPQKPEYLQFDVSGAWPAAGVYLKPFLHCAPKDIEVQSSEDGLAFRTIKRLTMKPGEEMTVAFDEVRAQHFRVVFLSSHPFRGDENWNVQVAEITLLSKVDLAKGATPRRWWDRSRAVDLTKSADETGRLTWDAPDGTWSVLRIGYTLHGAQIKCVGGGPSGPELDTMSAEAMDAHFAETGAKLIADAGPLVGKTLQYFHIDSWELGQPTWPPRMREEFQRRRGYDPSPLLPALLGRTVDNAETTRRFLQDYRRTAADLVAANYYGRLRELTLKGGLRGTHPESGGPFFTHWIDALQCEGINDVPMGEFWKRNSEPDGPITHHGNPSLKQVACATHIYGKPVCQAEAFTSFACDWIDDPWSMKDVGDAAFCEGLTRHVLCFWVHQPRLDAKPGFQWAHVGTHFDCHLTWWHLSHAWLTYLARCQYLLTQGLFVADFAHLQSEEIPSFLTPRNQQQPACPAGFDHDVLNTEVLLNRASAKDGRLTLPNGMSYRYLVLPHAANPTMSPQVLRKLRTLVDGGVTLIGPKPVAAPTLTGFPKCDEDTRRLADELWAHPRVLSGLSLEQLALNDALPPDVAFRHPSPNPTPTLNLNLNPSLNPALNPNRNPNPNPTPFVWIHRRDGATEIYFLSNQTSEPAAAEIVFRVHGKRPELWDAVTGVIRDLPEFRAEGDRTLVPMQFEPRQSFFVVFRQETSDKGVTAGERNLSKLNTVQQISGSWDVSFDPHWGGPERVTFERLEDWTQRSEDGIRYYSGTATYRKTFTLGTQLSKRDRMFLDLGVVRNLAAVRLNGRDLGVVWTAPWRVEITSAVRAGENELQIQVVNLWPNRLIGDGALPTEKRLTVTNARTYESTLPPVKEYQTYGCQICAERRKTGKPAALLPAGLLGPVTVLAHERP